VFEEAPTASDALTGKVDAMLLQSANYEFTKLDLREARRVLADAPGWLVPAANGKICLVELIYPLIVAIHGEILPPTLSTTCEPEGSVQTGHLYSTRSLSPSAGEAGETNVTGVVPDGVAMVTIVSPGRPSTKVEVLRNAYEVVVADPVAVRFVATKHGRRSLDTVKLVTFSGGSRDVEGGRATLSGG
jgi:hypothetical protein